MVNAYGGSPDPGEYIELYNTTAETLILQGCILRTSPSKTQELSATGSTLTIPPNGYFVLLKLAHIGTSSTIPSSATFLLTGANDWQLDNSPGTGSSAKTVSLTCNGTVIDTVSMTSTAGITAGRATELRTGYMSAAQNDTVSLTNWCSSQQLFGTRINTTTKIYGTPGAPNSCD